MFQVLTFVRQMYCIELIFKLTIYPLPTKYYISIYYEILSVYNFLNCTYEKKYIEINLHRALIVIIRVKFPHYILYDIF